MAAWLDDAKERAASHGTERLVCVEGRKFLALAGVAEAARELANHIDFGAPPPGWYEMRAAVSRLEEFD